MTFITISIHRLSSSVNFAILTNQLSWHRLDDTYAKSNR